MKLYEFWFYIKGVDRLFKRDFKAPTGLKLQDVLNNKQRYDEIREELRGEVPYRTNNLDDVVLVDVTCKRCRSWGV
jgi:regulator of protease activity HflC (stomatin/prohibitin superfamily)